MVQLAALAGALRKAEVAGLASLVAMPTSRSAFGILAQRAHLALEPVDDQGWVDIYRCSALRPDELVFREPFALVALDATVSEDDPQRCCEELVALLRDEDLHTQPIVTVPSGPAPQTLALMRNLETPFVACPCERLADIITCGTHQLELTRLVRSQVSLSLLNPYRYKGPVDGGMFVGRQSQIARLTAQDRSYALVGPRAIGKTSLTRRACAQLRARNEVAVSVEMRGSWDEVQLVAELLEQFHRDYDIDPIVLREPSLARLRRVIEDLAVEYVRQERPRPARPGAQRTRGRVKRVPLKKRTVTVVIDEADPVVRRCPNLLELVRYLDGQGWCRFVMVGYKELRKAVSDVQSSPLLNCLLPLKLEALPRRDCAGLITTPMIALGIELEQPDRIVNAICEESGGSPSRVQMLCYYLVESLAAPGTRRLTPEMARGGIHLADVRKELHDWFDYSTTPTERWLAALMTRCAPCDASRAVETAKVDWADIRSHIVQRELFDLVTANVLALDDSGCYDFAFPAMRELARPAGDTAASWRDVRRRAREALQQVGVL